MHLLDLLLVLGLLLGYSLDFYREMRGAHDHLVCFTLLNLRKGSKSGKGRERIGRGCYAACVHFPFHLLPLVKGKRLGSPLLTILDKAIVLLNLCSALGIWVCGLASCKEQKQGKKTYISHK